ncbi:hypothetical protein CBR_g38847 [Chara braunii]|uniref:Sulfhydryl oxidase n=1 Tax=Chara braunii TaxID=69332 RepID=A0A388LQN9_CHABU|nr:hypothetical protein CBR_g38847 [Chara braunii]|eukprot:GBG84565.1 hypothetical protein CBR_g38847 [Chara braunii]
MVRRAVLVGVSYADSIYLPKVQGAENDVRKAKSVLSAKFGFKEDDMRVLIDRPCHTYGKNCVVPPTKKNILEAIDWLVCGASPGDVLFFHFSGHGSQLPAGLGCAGEGLDDVLLPSDAGLGRDSVSNCITADEFKSKFARIPKGVTTVQVFDTGLGVADACSSADKRGYFLGTWYSKVLSFGGKTREQGKLAAIAEASAAACDNAAMRKVLFQWPSAWFAAAHGDSALESCFDGCVAGVFSHHFYDLLSSLEEPCLTNELLLSFVSRALRTAGYKQQPQFAAVDRCVDLSPILPVCVPSPPPPPLPVSDCCLPTGVAVCPVPPAADNVCDTKKPSLPPAPPAVEFPRPEELLVGELVRLLGIAGFDVACRIQTGWSKMTVEEQRKVYLELQSLGGVEAVKLGAELAADVCFFKLVSEFGADAIYFGSASGQSVARSTSAVTATDPDPSPNPSSGEELGRCTWMFLHALADQYPDCPTEQQRRDVNDILNIMTRIYPCEGCADHFKQLLEEHPPRTSNGYEFQQWMCETHNVVNRKIGKPEYPCHKLVRRAHTSACLGGACPPRRPAAAPAPAPKPAYVPPPPAMAKPSYVPPAAAASPAYVPPTPAKQVAAAAPPAPLSAAPKVSEQTKSAAPPSWQHSSPHLPWMPPVVARTPAYASDTYPFLRATNAAAPTRPSYEKKSSAVKPAAPVTAPAAPAARRSCPYCPAGRA